jgi:hypothetical protein
MSYFLRVFCASNDLVTREKVASTAREFWYSDENLSFKPEFGSPEMEQQEWKRLVIQYNPSKRPVLIHYNYMDETLAEEKEQAIKKIRSSEHCQNKNELIQYIRNSVQVFAIEVDQKGATKDCWEMLDGIQSVIAQSLDGIVYAPDDGFFDKQLNRICSLT